ncbi:MAG: glycosyltransferase, partial [Betaproteobacteria bacterium]|nr:glycosyltransferase [Betaproteobacteria bacterium]
MRIVQLVENLEAGGLERMALDLAVAQHQLGHHVYIYCLHDRGKLADEAEAAGVRVTAFHKKPGLSFSVLVKLMRQMRRDRIDVVHTHNPGVHHYGALAGHFARGAVVLSTRHSAIDSQGRPYQERYFKLVTRWTAAIASVCDRTRVELIERAGIDRAKSVVVYNGIRLGPYRAQPAAAPGAGHPSRIRFGTIGRMVPAKAHNVLLDAFAIVRRELPGAELRLAGYGELEEALRQQAARLDLGGSVSF